MNGSSDVIIWSLILIGILIVGLIIIMRVKKMMRTEEPGATAGFTLSDLRALHKNGKMSDDEFEKAKAQIVAVAKSGGRRPAPGAKQDL